MIEVCGTRVTRLAWRYVDGARDAVSLLVPRLHMRVASANAHDSSVGSRSSAVCGDRASIPPPALDARR